MEKFLVMYEYKWGVDICNTFEEASDTACENIEKYGNANIVKVTEAWFVFDYGEDGCEILPDVNLCLNFE